MSSKSRQSLDDELLCSLPRKLANLERRGHQGLPAPLEPVPVCHVNLACVTRLRGGSGSGGARAEEFTSLKVAERYLEAYRELGLEL